jgi:hypothetical protein
MRRRRAEGEERFLEDVHILPILMFLVNRRLGANGVKDAKTMVLVQSASIAVGICAVM